MAKRTISPSRGGGTASPSRQAPATSKAAGTRDLASLARERQPMPPFVKRALAEQGLMAAYRERPPYQQNDYLMWINSAKLEATKQKRLAQMVAELQGGTRYMRMAWRPGADRDPSSRG